MSAFYVGASVSLLASGVLLGGLDWRGAALVLGGVSALGFPIALLAQATSGTASRPIGGAAPGRLAQRFVAAHHPGVQRSLLGLYVSRGWLAAFLASVLLAAGYSQVDAASEGGKWAALMAGLGAVGVWVGGWVSDRWGRIRSAATIAAASGVLALAFGWLGGQAWAVLVAVGCVYGVLVAADSGIYSAAVTEYAPTGELGSAQAAQAFIGFLASAISPVAAGLVSDLGGGYGGAFVLGGLASIAGALILAPLLGGVHRRYTLERA